MKTRQEKIDELKAELSLYKNSVVSFNDAWELKNQYILKLNKAYFKREELSRKIDSMGYRLTPEQLEQKKALWKDLDILDSTIESLKETIKSFDKILAFHKPGFDKASEILAKIKKLEAPTVVDKAKSLLAKATSKKKQSDAPANDEQAVSETPETETATLPVGEEPTEPGE